MRIISGLRRGLKLDAPMGLATRPTTDRVKESVFNIIQNYLPADNVLDLFAGSGALGLEAISRGSKRCIFVDAESKAIDTIKSNINKARFEENSKVIKKDVFSFLAECTFSFDIIFLDPPYNKQFLEPVLSEIFKKNLLLEDGIIVVESEVGGEEIKSDDFSCIKSVKYGKTVISILKHK